MTRRHATALVVVLAVVAAVGALRAWARARHDTNTLAYAARITGLPTASATSVESADDGELSTQLYAVLASPSVEALARTLPVVTSPDAWPGHWFFRDEAIGSFPRPAPGAELRGVHGCNEHNEWYGYLDPRSGQLWLEIMYPDHGGDTPGCRPPPWDH